MRLSLGLHAGLADGTYQAAVTKTDVAVIFDRGTVLYKRRPGGIWERRVSRTTFSDQWKRVARLPRAVRELGARVSSYGLEIEFDTTSRTATMREPWRWT